MHLTGLRGRPDILAFTLTPFGFNGFVLINPCVLSANSDFLGFSCFINFSILLLTPVCLISIDGAFECEFPGDSR